MSEFEQALKKLVDDPNYSIADSVCQQTITAGGSAKDMSRAVSGRILAIAAAQDLLSTTATEGAELKEIVGKLASSLAPTPSRIRVEGESFRLPVDATTPFALILHELATNALKYGAWSKERASRCGVVATVANINAHGGTAANREGSRGVGLEWQGE